MGLGESKCLAQTRRAKMTCFCAVIVICLYGYYPQPDYWKIANTTPLIKKGEMQQKGNS